MNTAEPATIADRMADLLKAVDRYDLLSNGLRDEVRRIVPGGPDDVHRLEPDDIARVLFEIVNVFRWRRLEPVLALYDLPHPRYPIGEDPSSNDPPPVTIWDPPRGPEPTRGGWSVLGFEVGFPIGIPSCELTCNADWIEYYARKGFHVLTYRTVRNRPTKGSPYDWVFLAGLQAPWEATYSPTEVTRADDKVPRDWLTVSTATSFVAPCPPSDMWVEDMRDARRRLDNLGGHHLLIASVTDSVPLKDKTPQTLAADFVEVARKAETAGAQAIECYLAQATARDTSGQFRPCEQNIETSLAIVDAVRGSLKPHTRLLIKLSGNLSGDLLDRIVVPLAKARLIDGVSGISPVRVQRVIHGDGQTLWGTSPPGVAGYVLRKVGRTFVERLAGLRQQHGLRFEILAMGGIMTPKDVSTHLNLGASAVQMATAAVSSPSLAIEAFAHYRATVEVCQEWDGVVEEVDPERGTFWARLVRTDADGPDEEAQFELNEFRPDERDEIQLGTVFCLRSGLLVQGGELVRHSAVRLREVRGLSAQHHLQGRSAAPWGSSLQGPGPDLAR
ncbi:MAG: hypothetical protein LC808_05430 [Actinobacteria bacterium]|nr:hypothetical protein [Actinomycetota bacterium]